MSDDSKPDGKGATALDAFDTLDLTPKKLITQLRFSESGDLLRVTFTREDGSSGDFQFNSSEIVKMVSGDTSKVADMLASDYPDIFSREFATRLLDGVSASSEFQAHAATLQQAVQEPLQNTGLGTQDAKPGTQDAEPSLGGTQSFANLVNMVAPPGAAHLSGDSGIPDPSRLVDLSAVPRGSGADESSAFLVQPDGTSTPPRVVPPPVPPISSEKRGKPGETVVLPDAREDDETVVLEGDDIKMESEPVAPVAAVGEHLGPVQTRGDISLVSDVPEPLQFAGETQPSVVVPEMESPTQVIRTAPEPLHPEGRGDRDEDVTQEIPADQKPKPVTPALVFPPSEGSESAQIDSSAQASVGEPTTQAASVQPAPQDAPQSSDATPQDAKPIPVVSIGRSGHVLVLLNDKSEVILGGRSILRVLNANKSGGRDEAARILSAEYPGIQSDLAGLILDKVCATDFVSNAIDFLSSSRQSASDQASSAHTKPIPPVSLSIRYNLLVIGHDSLEIVLDRAVVTRILLANKRGGRSEAERVLEHRPMGITSDDDKIILDQLCSPGFASTFRQLLSSQNQPASVQPSTPTQPPAQPSVSAPAQPAVSTPQPSPPVPTKDELNAMYLAAAGNGEVDEIKRAIALGADKEAKDSEKKTALMRAVAGLHLPAVQCLIEEIKVNLYTKGVFGFTVIDNLQALGDSDEAKAVKTYIQEIHDNGMRRVHDALVAKSAQDAITSVLPAPRKSAKPFLSNLPWGWLIGATVVTSLSIVTAASSSFRNSVFDFAKGVASAAGVIFTDGIKETKDGGLRFTGFSSENNWWKEGKYKLSKEDALDVANQVLIGRMDYARDILTTRFDISNSLADDMLEEMNIYDASRIAKKPFLQLAHGRYQFTNVYINDVFPSCSISKDGMKKVVNAYIAQGEGAALDILNDELFATNRNGRLVSSCSSWAGVTFFSKSTLTDMMRAILLSSIGRPFIHEADMAFQAQKAADAEAKKTADEVAKLVEQERLRKEMEAKDAAALKAAEEAKNMRDLLESAITPPVLSSEDEEHIRSVAAEKRAAEEKAAKQEAERAEKQKQEQAKKAAQESAAKKKAEDDRKSREAAAKRAMSKGAGAETRRVLSDCERSCKYGGGTSMQRACISGCR